MIKRVESSFLQKNFNRSLTEAIDVLCNLNGQPDLCTQHTQLDNTDVLRILSILSTHRNKNESRYVEQETNCVAIIIQTLFELKQSEIAIRVLDVYYGKIEYSPPELQSVL